MRNNSILKINNLEVSFLKSSQKVVQNFNLELFKGDKYAIIGESGSGKSVLILAILRLIEEAKIEGSIIYNNKDLLKLNRKELDKIRGNKIAYIPQGSGNGFNPLMKVGIQVGETLVIHKGLSVKASIKAAINLFKQFNLLDEERIVYQYPHTYSGGMKQRAMIAMGIATGTEIILADEPTKGLDSSRIKLVTESFNSLEQAYITITHDLVFAKQISNRLGVIHSSYLIEEGLTREIFEEPFHPYTKAMIRALPENGLNIDNVIATKTHISDGCRYRYDCVDCFDKCDKTPPFVEFRNRKVRCWKYA